MEIKEGLESDGPWKWVYNVISNKEGFTFEQRPVMK